MRNLVYLVDISKASHLPDAPVETSGLPAGTSMASKRLVADLKALGWEAEKAEGLTIIDDRTIALASDNDFGLALEMVNPAKDKDGKPAKKPGDYATGPDRKLTLDGKPVETTIALKPSGEKTSLWILTLPKAIKEYAPK